MRTRNLIIGLVISGILLFSIFTVIFFRQSLTTKQLPSIGKVNPFQLVDSTGSIFPSEKLNGKVWIADFFFTTCGDICPVMSKNMASLSRTFERLPGISLISITVNPENDTPAVLAEYAKTLKTNAKNWHFLTGERNAIRKIVIDSFKLGAIDQPIFHSGKFALVDRHGYIRGYYEGTETEEINKLFADAAELLKER